MRWLCHAQIGRQQCGGKTRANKFGIDPLSICHLGQILLFLPGCGHRLAWEYYIFKLLAWTR
jgi:hypothetical protein